VSQHHTAVLKSKWKTGEACYQLPKRKSWKTGLSDERGAILVDFARICSANFARICSVDFVRIGLIVVNSFWGADLAFTLWIVLLLSFCTIGDKPEKNGEHAVRNLFLRCRTFAGLFSSSSPCWTAASNLSFEVHRPVWRLRDTLR
jgi:hypothetical protein